MEKKLSCSSTGGPSKLVFKSQGVEQFRNLSPIPVCQKYFDVIDQKFKKAFMVSPEFILMVPEVVSLLPEIIPDDVVRGSGLFFLSSVHFVSFAFSQTGKDTEICTTESFGREKETISSDSPLRYEEENWFRNLCYSSAKGMASEQLDGLRLKVMVDMYNCPNTLENNSNSYLIPFGLSILYNLVLGLDNSPTSFQQIRQKLLRNFSFFMKESERIRSNVNMKAIECYFRLFSSHSSPFSAKVPKSPASETVNEETTTHPDSSSTRLNFIMLTKSPETHYGSSSKSGVPEEPFEKFVLIPLGPDFDILRANSLSKFSQLKQKSTVNSIMVDYRVALAAMHKQLELPDITSSRSLMAFLQKMSYTSQDAIDLVEEAMLDEQYKRQDAEEFLELSLIDLINDLPFASDIYGSTFFVSPYKTIMKLIRIRIAIENIQKAMEKEPMVVSEILGEMQKINETTLSMLKPDPSSFYRMIPSFSSGFWSLTSQDTPSCFFFLGKSLEVEKIQKEIQEFLGNKENVLFISEDIQKICFRDTSSKGVHCIGLKGEIYTS